MGSDAPLLLTILFVWQVPKYFLIHAYRQEQRYKVAKRITKMEEEQKLIKLEESIAQSRFAAVDAEISLAQKTAEAEKQDPTIIWRHEYDELKDRNVLESFLPSIITSVYSYGGHLKSYIEDGETVNFRLAKHVLASADSAGLITIDNKSDRISLTEKGRFFVARSQLE